MGEGRGEEEKALSLFPFHLSPFPQKRLILRLRAFQAFHSLGKRLKSVLGYPGSSGSFSKYLI